MIMQNFAAMGVITVLKIVESQTASAADEASENSFHSLCGPIVYDDDGFW